MALAQTLSRLTGRYGKTRLKAAFSVFLEGKWREDRLA
jgi:hypothetical protein